MPIAAYPRAVTDDNWVALGLDSNVTGAYDALYEGIPTWMEASFWRWVRLQITGTAVGGGRVLLTDVLRRVERACRFPIGYEGLLEAQAVSALRTAVSVDPMRAVRLADFLVGDPEDPYGAAARAQDLEQILRESGSAWTVGARKGRTGLVRRVPQGVQDAADTIMGGGHRAGERLAQAWSAVFGVDPNPSNGYSLAIKAVEDAAIPVLMPKDQKATLGTIIGHMGSVVYALPFDREPRGAASGLVLKQMSQLLWTGQSDRHGGNEGATSPVTQAAAEAAVVLAVPLVQWFTSGQVQRV